MTTTLKGPIEENTWPEKLLSRTVTPGHAPRIHGYDVESDLVRHYTFLDTLLLSIGGDLPTDVERAAMDVALQHVAPAPVSRAPTHTAMLTHLCGGTRSAAFGAGALMLAEEARWTLERYDSWLKMLSEGACVAPVDMLAQSEDERASVARLRASITATGLRVAAFDCDLDKTAALLAVFHACGFRGAGQIELLFVIARLATAGAEALATAPAQFRTYPIDLPRFRFEARA